MFPYQLPVLLRLIEPENFCFPSEHVLATILILLVTCLCCCAFPDLGPCVQQLPCQYRQEQMEMVLEKQFCGYWFLFYSDDIFLYQIKLSCKTVPEALVNQPG